MVTNLVILLQEKLIELKKKLVKVEELILPKKGAVPHEQPQARISVGQCHV
jgi:hypothetical protein